MDFRSMFDRYKQNMDDWGYLEDQMFRQDNLPACMQFLQERSEKLRRIFSDNEAILTDLADCLEAGVDRQTADDLCALLMELYFAFYDEPYIYELVGKKLWEYYEKERDYGKMVPLINVISFELIDYFTAYTDAQEGISEPARAFLKVTELQDHYTEIKDPGERRFFFAAYCNLISPLSKSSLALREKLFDLYEQAWKLWEDPAVQKLDGNNEDIQRLMQRVDDNFLSVEEYILECDEQTRYRFFNKAEEIIARKEKNGENMRPGDHIHRIRNKGMVLYGKKTRRQVVEEYIECLERMPDPDFSDPDELKTERYILDIHGLSDEIMLWLRSEEFTDEERYQYLMRFLPRVITMVGTIPYHFRSGLMNEICITWYKNASAVLPEFTGRLAFLKKMVICRQPITYIHSLMVSRISLLIAEEILDSCPELFLEAFEKQSVEELLADRENVLTFIDRCGLIHDIGKTQMVNVINQQTRRLSDREFDLIRQHPERGFAMMAADEDFLPYQDVIIGHHKTYDGKGGYPMSFDNTKSPKRILIDLISIADCTDAATDKLGRNYAVGKEFHTLLDELTAQAGTRYNPDIVNVIAGSRRLKASLAKLTTTGRYDVYYDAYRFIENL